MRHRRPSLTHGSQNAPSLWRLYHRPSCMTRESDSECYTMKNRSSGCLKNTLFCSMTKRELLYESDYLEYSGIFRRMVGCRGLDFMSMLKIGLEANCDVHMMNRLGNSRSFRMIRKKRAHNFLPMVAEHLMDTDSERALKCLRIYARWEYHYNIRERDNQIKE